MKIRAVFRSSLGNVGKWRKRGVAGRTMAKNKTRERRGKIRSDEFSIEMKSPAKKMVGHGKRKATIIKMSNKRQSET